MPKVSVIVPVFNTEKYVGICINSILNQSFRDFELFLIDDGSSDNSIKICENYSKLDNRIKVIKKTNEGVSVTRNKGIELATGEFIQFVDSDDCINPNMLEKLISCMEIYDADIAFCGMRIVEKKNGEMVFTDLTSKRMGKECVYDKKTFIKLLPELFWETSIMEGPCNRIYRTSMLKENDIKFPTEMNYGEDCIFNINYYARVRNAVFIQDILYYYIWYNDESLARCYKEQIFDNQMRQVESLKICVKENGKLTKSGAIHLANYTAYQTIKCIDMIVSKRSKYSEYEKKRLIGHIVQNKTVQEAFLKSSAIAPEHLPYKEFVLSCDIGSMLDFLCPRPVEITVIANLSKPGFANKACCKLLQYIKKIFKFGKIHNTAEIIELNLKTVGILTTIKRILRKIFNKQIIK